jgi:hypothetical protein
MADWKTYKGQKPWLLSKSQAPNIYNQGHRITTPGDPSWDIEYPGLSKSSPITPGHDPCGMWVRNAAATSPPATLPPIIPIINTPANLYSLSNVVWVPNKGSAQYGRFVASYSDGEYICYSDDGGNHWTQYYPPEISGSVINYLEYHPETGIITASLLNHYSLATGRSCTSEDGITWTIGPYLPNNRYNVCTTDYNPTSGIYFSTAYRNGYGSYHIYSYDALNWTVSSWLTSYSRYEACAYFEGYQWLLDVTYDYGHRSTSTVPPSYTDINGTIYDLFHLVSAPVRVRLAAGDDLLLFTECYLPSGSSTWLSSGVHVTYIDYNRESKIFIGKEGIYGNLLYFTRDAEDWVTLDLGTVAIRDVAIGRASAVSVDGTPSYNRYITFA